MNEDYNKSNLNQVLNCTSRLDLVYKGVRMDAMTTKQRIETVNYFKRRSQEIIAREEQCMKKQDKILIKIQDECKHKFEYKGVQECKICGLTGM